MLSTRYLIAATIVLSALVVILSEARMAGSVPTTAMSGIATAVFAANGLVAVAGLWTRHRALWTGYLLLSIAAFLLIGAATPINALCILAKTALL